MTLYFYEADNKKMRNIYTSIRLYPYDTDIVNWEIIACIYYCDFVILDLNAIFNFYESYYCVYNSVAIFAIIKNLAII